MKTQIKALAASTFFAAISSITFAQTNAADRSVNAYGEPAGIANVPQVIVTPAVPTQFTEISSMPGLNGLYPAFHTVDRRNFESSGSWKARTDAVAAGTVNIGVIEIMNSGPTGAVSADVRAAERAEVTEQVLTRVSATDRTMATLKTRSRSLDKDTQARFDVAATEVATRRQSLREDLKTMRAASDEQQWVGARAAITASFNSYVESQHRAEQVIAPTNSTS